VEYSLAARISLRANAKRITGTTVEDTQQAGPWNPTFGNLFQYPFRFLFARASVLKLDIPGGGCPIATAMRAIICPELLHDLLDVNFNRLFVMKTFPRCPIPVSSAFY